MHLQADDGLVVAAPRFPGPGFLFLAGSRTAGQGRHQVARALQRRRIADEGFPLLPRRGLVRADQLLLVNRVACRRQVLRRAVDHPGVFQEIGELALELLLFDAGHLERAEVDEAVYVDGGGHGVILLMSRGKRLASRIFFKFRIFMVRRSSPMPRPPWGGMPKRKVSR